MDPADIIEDNKILYAVKMSGPRYLEDVYCRLRLDSKETREAKITLDFVAIENSDKPFSSPMAGFIGLGPYTSTSDPNLQATNFLR